MRTHPWPASSQANPGFVTLIQCGDQGMAVVVRCDKNADTGGVFRASPLVAIRIGGLSPSPGQRVEREYRPVNAAKRQGAEVADICPRREDGVTPRCDRIIGAPVSDAGLQADDRKRRGLDTLAA